MPDPFARLDATILDALHGRLNAQTDAEERCIDELVTAVRDALLADWETVDAAIEAHCVSLKRTRGGDA